MKVEGFGVWYVSCGGIGKWGWGGEGYEGVGARGGGVAGLCVRGGHGVGCGVVKGSLKLSFNGVRFDPPIKCDMYYIPGMF